MRNSMYTRSIQEIQYTRAKETCCMTVGICRKIQGSLVKDPIYILDYIPLIEMAADDAC